MKPPSKSQIAAVMAALGRRNRGRRKAMTRAEVAQRRAAARASAAARLRRRVGEGEVAASAIQRGPEALALPRAQSI